MHMVSTPSCLLIIFLSDLLFWWSDSLLCILLFAATPVLIAAGSGTWDRLFFIYVTFGSIVTFENYETFGN